MEPLVYILESSLFKGICLFIVTLMGAFITDQRTKRNNIIQ